MPRRPDYGHQWRQLRDRVRRSSSVCHICGKPIDPSLKYPHPGAFTVDHLEPVQMRPDLALTYSNLRPAHNRCNRMRGTGKRRSGGRPSQDW